MGASATARRQLLDDLLPRLEAAGIKGQRVSATPDRAMEEECVCCEGADELISTLVTLPQEERAVVLVEAGPEADPYRLLEWLHLRPELRSRYAPVALLLVVDPTQWPPEEGNALLQAEAASHAVFHRPDAALEETREALRWINPRLEETDPARLATLLAGPLPKETAFCALHVALPPQVHGQALLDWLCALPAGVARVRGIVELREIPGFFFLFEREAEKSQNPTLLPLPPSPAIAPGGVLMGVNLPTEALRREMKRYFS